MSYIPVQMLYYYSVFAPIFQSFLLAFRIIFQKNFLRARVRALYRGDGAQEKQNAGRFAAAGRGRAEHEAARRMAQQAARGRAEHKAVRGAVHGDGARRKGEAVRGGGCGAGDAGRTRGGAVFA